MAYAPERTIEGNAINEIQELPQIIGGLDNKSTLLVDQFFRKITSTIVDVGSLEGAEMVKILNNTLIQYYIFLFISIYVNMKTYNFNIFYEYHKSKLNFLSYIFCM